jgi:hypothetical protein
MHGVNSVKFIRDVNKFLSVLSTFGTRDLHVMLLSIRNFHQNWQGKGHTFLMGTNKMTYNARIMKPYDILKVKNISVMPVYYVKKYTICNLVLVLLNPAAAILLFYSLQKCTLNKSFTLLEALLSHKLITLLSGASVAFTSDIHTARMSVLLRTDY